MRQRTMKPEEVEVTTMEGVFAISVSVGKTLNLGNYESARIDIGITQSGVSEKDKTQVLDNLLNYTKCELDRQISEVDRSWPHQE